MAENTSKKCTPEDDARLRAQLEGGTSHQLVAAKLKRTIISIRGRARILGMPLAHRKVKK